MDTFSEIINLDGFAVDNIDIKEITRVEKWLPVAGVIDLNIAEQGLVMTLHGQNICQEKIVKVERLIGILETNKNKAWSEAALVKSSSAEYKEMCKTAKAKEWFAQADEDYIKVCNQLSLAKAAKRWLENKASYFSGWHYTFKTFLRRDYSLEKLGNLSETGYNVNMSDTQSDAVDSSSDDTEWA